MDIRTKLVFALVAVALLSMFTMGAVVATEVQEIMRSGRLEQLDELAETRRQALLGIVEGWRDRTELIAERTPLRAALDELERTGSAAASRRVQALLEESVVGPRAPLHVRLNGITGETVASVTRVGAQGVTVPVGPAEPPPPVTEYVGVDFGGNAVPRVTFVAPMTWDERVIGSLVATLEARELLDLTSSYQGLGETGETLVLALDADSVPRALNPTRHAQDAVGMALPSGERSLGRRALRPEDERASDELSDYRGEPVWAATRFIPDTGWGVVVKVDAVEEEQAFRDFTGWLSQTALVLAAFAILAGFAFGMRFALPIHALAEVANRIRGGDMGARAKVTVEDEVGALTRDFNAMADELQQRMEELREFQKFFDVSIDLMCIAGTDGYFKRVNPAFKRALGWSEEELVVRPFFDFVHPDDVEKTQREVAKLAQGIPTIEFANRYLKRDGSYALLRWSSFPEGGRLYAIARVMQESAG